VGEPLKRGVMPLLVMGDLKEIRAMWDDWKAIPFPEGYSDEDVAGICVTSLDTFAAGCIDTFISSKGRLDSQRSSVLVQCKRDLEIVVKNLDGEAQVYFKNLLLISKRVLRVLRVNPNGAA
jgi:hypothetical protein